MRYKAPTIDNRPYWVPIVTKDRSSLISYVRGIRFVLDMVMQNENVRGSFDIGGSDLCLDSSRFNDIIPDGRRESEMTKQELLEYQQRILNSLIERANSRHPDNNPHIFQDYFLTIECSCGLGFYSFKEEKNVPKETFKCVHCGRTVIHYTGHDDYEYDEFDG